MDNDLIAFLREITVPGGTANVVRLDNAHPYYNVDFIRKCIDDMEHVARNGVAFGLVPSPLQTLGMWILLGYAEYHGYKTPKGG